jgi:ribose transport system permease protein
MKQPPGRDAATFRDRMIRVLALGEVGVVAALAIVATFFWLLEPAFLSARNVRAILGVVSFVGIIAIGQTALLVGGEFDLSVGSVAGLSAVVSARLMATLGWPVPIALLAGAVLGGGIFLLSDAASFITGSALTADGGMTALLF